MSKALLLVDIQNDYFKNGAMELVNMEDAANKAGKILKSFREKNLPVYHIQHLSMRPGSTFFLPDTKGVEIHDSVQPLETEPVIQKFYPNSFRDTTLKSQCEKDGIKKLVICGAMSHMCIDATTRAAFDFGFECMVVEDACATRNLEFDGREIVAADVHGAFMSALSAVYAEVVGFNQLIKSYKNQA